MISVSVSFINLTYICRAKCELSFRAHQLSFSSFPNHLYLFEGALKCHFLLFNTCEKVAFIFQQWNWPPSNWWPDLTIIRNMRLRSMLKNFRLLKGFHDSECHPRKWKDFPIWLSNACICVLFLESWVMKPIFNLFIFRVLF